MLYTPSHAELAQHPKTRKLARLLGVSIPAALGHLHLLWHFALTYAPDGDLTRFDDAEIADGCLWEEDPSALCAALMEAGWIDATGDGGRQVHDWNEHGGKLVNRKEANAQRMRDARANHKQSTKKTRATHVQRTSAARAEPEERRGEESRETHVSLAADEPPQVESPGLHLVRRVPKPKDEPARPNPVWDALVAGIGIAPTTTAERSKYGMVTRELRDLGASPEDVLRRCANYREHWPGVDLTPTALLEHWSRMDKPPPTQAARPRTQADHNSARKGRLVT